MVKKEKIGENGKISAHKLKKVGDDEQLYRPAAKSYLHMQTEAKKEGVKIQLNDGYRICGKKGDYLTRNCSSGFTQWCAWEKYKAGVGNLAANPTTSKGCTSMHGYGLAIDVKGTSAQNWIKKHGEKYGWYWTGGAFSQIENWHFDYFQDKDTIRKKGKIKSIIGYSVLFISVIGFAYSLHYFTRKK